MNGTGYQDNQMVDYPNKVLLPKNCKKKKKNEWLILRRGYVERMADGNLHPECWLKRMTTRTLTELSRTKPRNQIEPSKGGANAWQPPYLLEKTRALVVESSAGEALRRMRMDSTVTTKS